MEAFEVFLPFLGQPFNVLPLIAVGFAVGVLAGFFGMGGGWVVTPALFSLGFPMDFAIGTGLANVTAQSAVATVKHRRMGNVDPVLGSVVGLLMMGGVEAGKRVVNRLVSLGLAGTVVGWAYVTLLLALALYMVRDYVAGRGKAPASDGGRGGHERADRRGALAASGPWFLRVPPIIELRRCGIRVSLWALAALGLGIGFLAGLLGCGGGFALVPAFIYLLGVPTFVAVGTSLLCVIISGAYGTFTYGFQGDVELIAALWMVAGSVVGAQLGVAATRYVRGAGLRLLYAVMLLVASGGLVLKQLAVLPDSGGESRLAPVVILGGALLMCLIIIGRMAASVLARGRQR